MNQSVSVLEYGAAGNTFNIVKALEAVGCHASIVNTPKDLFNSNRLVIPGVGSFCDAMNKLNSSGMDDAIKEFVACGRPVIGICLGMQLLASVGFEYGDTSGLNLVRGEVRLMECGDVVPHMRFNSLQQVSDSPLFRDIHPTEQFYFMHSYELLNYTNVISLTEYSNHQFVSAIQNENVYGVQFHPEKSRQAGLKIFKNFLEV